MSRKRIKPLSYDEEGYSHVCKTCMARAIIEESATELDRTLCHVMRDMQSLIRKSDDPLPVKVRKRSGLDFREQKINSAIDHMLSAFYDVWSEVEGHADEAQKKVDAHRSARARGAAAKLAKDPTQVAKAEAISLWPEAHRQGWTAERMRLELERKGLTAKPDTVRKWMAKLRKTGTC